MSTETPGCAWYAAIDPTLIGFRISYRTDDGRTAPSQWRLTDRAAMRAAATRLSQFRGWI